MTAMVRWAARMMIPGLMQLFDSPTAIVNDLISMNMGYRRQIMFRDVNEFLDIRRLASAFTGFSASAPRPDELYGRSWSMKRPERYKITGTVEVRDGVSGEISTKVISYYTDRKPVGDEELEFIDKYLRGLNMYDKSQSVASFQPMSGQRNMSLPMFQEVE